MAPPPGRRARRRRRPSGPAALALIPAVAVLGVIGTLLVGESATGAAVGERIASLQTTSTVLGSRSALLQTTLAQVRSAGTVEAGAARAGLGPPISWTTVPSVTSGPRDPLLPVLRLLGEAPAAQPPLPGPAGPGPTS